MKVLAIAIAIALQVTQPQPLAFPQPDGSPETIGDAQDFPFLPPLQGARLIQSSRVSGPLELKSATADGEAVLDPAREDDRLAGRHVDALHAALERHPAFQDVEHLVLAGVDVQRGP